MSVFGVYFKSLRLFNVYFFFECSIEKSCLYGKKARYGLKQARRAWYARIDSYLIWLGFSKSHADPNLYYKVVNNATVILLLYVDDLFLTGEESLITHCKKELAYEFNMKDRGLIHYYLGLEIW